MNSRDNHDANLGVGRALQDPLKLQVVVVARIIWVLDKDRPKGNMLGINNMGCFSDTFVLRMSCLFVKTGTIVELNTSSVEERGGEVEGTPIQFSLNREPFGKFCSKVDNLIDAEIFHLHHVNRL